MLGAVVCGSLSVSVSLNWRELIMGVKTVLTLSPPMERVAGYSSHLRELGASEELRRTMKTKGATESINVQNLFTPASPRL